MIVFTLVVAILVAVILPNLVDFVLATQPKDWKKLEQHYGKEAVREQFLKRLAAEGKTFASLAAPSKAA